MPMPVIGIDDAVQVTAAGDTYWGALEYPQGLTCVVRESGKVFCWGSGYGNLPVEIEGISDAVQVSAASGTPTDRCIVRTSGEVVCFEDVETTRGDS